MTSTSSRQAQRKSTGNGRRTKVAVLAITLVIAGGFVYLYWDQSAPKLSIDWTAKLAIFDARIGKNLTIPTGVGVPGGIWMNHTFDSYAGTGYALMSTRDPSAQDETATISIQAVAPVHVPVLGDFFDIWGKPLNSTCVGYGVSSTAIYCQGSGNNPPRPWVTDGSSTFCLSRNIPFSNKKTLEIIIGTPAVDRTCS